MIHIQLDPSVITVKDTFGISLSMAGVYMEMDDKEKELLPKNDSLPTVWKKEDGTPLENETEVNSALIQDMKSTLYPWNWTSPDKIRVYFIKDKDEVSVLKSEDLDISSLVGSRNDKDEFTIIQAMYEKELDSRIFKNNTISYREILQEIQEIGNEKKDIHINENYNEDIEPSFFLSASIAGKAQKLAPFNELLKLVFFSNADVDLTDCKAFVAFPIDNEKRRDWTFKDISNIENDIIEQYKKHKYNTSELTTVELAYTRTDSTGAEYDILVESAITPLPEPNQEKHGIKLRDENADFEGTLTTLDVSDTDDWSEKWLEKLFYNLKPLEEITGYINDYAGQYKIMTDEVKDNIKNLSFLFFRSMMPEIKNNINFGEVWVKNGDENDLVLIDTKFHKNLRNSLKAKFNYNDNELQEITKKAVDFQPDWKKLSEYLLTSIKKDEEIGKELIGKLTNFSKIIDKTIIDDDFKEADFLSTWNAEIKLINEKIKINSRKEQWMLNCIIEYTKETTFKTIPDHEGKAVEVKLYNMFTYEKPWNILDDLCTDIPAYGNYFIPADETNLKLFKQRYLKFISPYNIDTHKNIHEDKDENLRRIRKRDKFQWKLISKCFFNMINENLITETINFKLTAPQLRTLVARCYALKNLMNTEKEALDKVIYSNIPPVRIRLNNVVEKMDLKIHQDPTNEMIFSNLDDDLFDEIGGYVVIQTRSKNMNDKLSFEEEWKYLNRCKVNSVAFKRDNDKRTIGKEIQHSFTIPFLIPSFLPKFSIDDNKKNADFSLRQRFVEIKNEKNSLVAGFQKTNNDFKFDNQIIEHEDLMLENVFDIEADDAGQIMKHVPYTYLYGYHYKFKAYGVLNSGVLPPELRNGSMTSFNKKLETVNDENVKDFHFLRRVPVSAPRISAYSGIYNDNKIPITALPEGLKLLTYELEKYQETKEKYFGIKDEQIKKTSQQELPVTLLHNKSDKMFLTIKKPSTHFWNWYAWTAKDIDDKMMKEAINVEYNYNRLKKHDPSKPEECKHFCDPAVSNYLLIEAEILFSLDDSRKNASIIVPFTDDKSNNPLEDLDRSLKIIINNKAGNLEIKNTKDIDETMQIDLREGEVLQIRISSLIDSKYFTEDNSEQRFHKFMNKNLDSHKIKGTDYYQSPPSYYFVETAAQLDTLDIKAEDIWKNIIFEENTELTKDKVIAYLEIDNNKNLCKRLCLTHNITTEHQMWNWNGKLSTFNEKILNDDLDPVKGKTTEAMKFEVDFSERPDFTSNVTRQLFLTASPNESTRQIIFEHSRPDEKRALYYLLHVQVHSRYELLEGYNQVVKASSDLLDKTKEGKGDTATRWRRHFRKTRITKKLPRPTTRFIVPLTKSLQTEENLSNDLNVASLLVVLDDVWYTEAGLAEKLQVGIEVVEKSNKKGDPIDYYMQMGKDPIISGNGTPKIDKDNNHILDTFEQDPLDETKLIKTTRFVFDAVGPIGLTFDQGSILPKINSSCFIVNIPKASEIFIENKDFNLTPWSMVKVSVRRALTEKLHKSIKNDVELDKLGSGWTESVWVQHLPDTGQFIPRSWRDDNKDAIDLTIEYHDDKDNKTNKPCEINIVDKEYLMNIEKEVGENCEKFLILSKKSFDVGGLSTESYVATISLGQKEKGCTINHCVEDMSKAFEKHDESINAYGRILTVRTNVSQNNKLGDYKKSMTVWEGLFGASVNNDVALDEVQSDSIYALPLISERVSVNVKINPK